MQEESVQEVLERTEKQIQLLTKNNANVRDRWRRHISRLIIWSIILELVYSSFYYLFLYKRYIDLPPLEDDDYASVSNRRAEIAFWRVADAALIVLIPLTSVPFFLDHFVFLTDAIIASLSMGRIVRRLITYSAY